MSHACVGMYATGLLVRLRFCMATASVAMAPQFLDVT